MYSNKPDANIGMVEAFELASVAVTVAVKSYVLPLYPIPSFAKSGLSS